MIKSNILDNTKPVVFIHVPKCGGSSVRRLLQSTFNESVILHYRDEPNKLNPPPISLQQAEYTINKFGCCVIYGHFNSKRGFGIQDNVPWAQQFITILRDPFEQYVSAFKYSKRNKPKEITLEAFEIYLSTVELNYLNHFPQVVTFENFKSIISDGFCYIGFDFNLERSMNEVLSLFSINLKPEIPRVNVSPSATFSFEKFRKEFEERHKLEVNTYRYALEVWNESQN